MGKKEHKFGLTPLLSIEDLAAYLHVSAPMVRSWIKDNSSNIPPGFNIGTSEKPVIRFAASDVQKHISNLRAARDSSQIIKNVKPNDADIIDIVPIEDDEE